MLPSHLLAYTETIKGLAMTAQTEVAMLPDFAISVTGDPAPQGSKRHVGNGRMIEASAKLPDWRTAVALQTRAAMKDQKWDGYGEHVPVRVVLTFRLKRPTSLPKITK